MGRPEFDRGGPGGGGMGRPDALVGRTAGRAGASGRDPRSGTDGGADGAGRGGAAGAEDGLEALAAGALTAGADGEELGAGREMGRGPGGGGTLTSLAGRLVTNRLERGTSDGDDGDDDADGAGADEAAWDGASERDLPDAPLSPPAVEAAAEALDVGAALGSSSTSGGCTSRRKPSRSALRRTRSAWASSMEDEWLFTPMPKETQRSSASLFVRPSSRASS